MMFRPVSVSLFALSMVFAGCAGEPDLLEEEAPDQSENALGKHSVRGGAVFTLSNDALENRVLAFRRSERGELRLTGEYPTGGLGAGSGLGSQGALTLTEDARYLIVVDAGSNELSSFAVHGSHLVQRSRVKSGGTRPVSVAAHGNLVYALNAAEPAAVVGFRLHHGALIPIPNSARPLSVPAPAPAQVAFTPDGEHLVVTERATHAISSFHVRRDGRLSEPVVSPAAGRTPFGFTFTHKGDLIVSEAASASTSSYHLDRHGKWLPVSAAVPGFQQAPCWATVSRDSRFAYVANAGSSSITGYRVHRDGSLSLLDEDGVTGEAGENSRPLDMAVDRDEHLYLLDTGNHVISEFEIGPRGALARETSSVALPPTAAGIAAY